MNRILGLRLGLVGVAAIATIVLGGLLLAGTVSAQDGDGVSISSGGASPGDSDEVTLTATDIGDPGLGAWSIDIIYDSSVITAVACTAEQGGACNPNFEDDTVRISGATAGGLEGDSTLGTIEFECDGGGSSDLTVDPATFADATAGLVLGALGGDGIEIHDGPSRCCSRPRRRADRAPGRGCGAATGRAGWP